MSRRLPPLNSLRAFEAVARSESISRAADELFVTHGAVSKQIKILENFLGEHLFERSSTGLVLTGAGVELAAELSPIFNDLRRTFSGYATPNGKKHTCRLSTVPSFASQFLVPRLRKFRDENPDINLQILTTPRLVDFEREEVDLAVRFGTGNWKDVVSDPIGGGHLIPTCAASILERFELDDPAAVLMGTPLIHRYSTAEWAAWLESAGLMHIDSQSGLVLQDTNVAIKATIEGHGACLLPRILILTELESGALRTLSSIELDIERQYFLVRPSNQEQHEYSKQVIQWLRKEIKMSLSEP